MLFQRHNLVLGIDVRNFIPTFCRLELYRDCIILFRSEGFSGMQITQQFVDCALQPHPGTPGDEIWEDRRSRDSEDSNNYHHFKQRQTTVRLRQVSSVEAEIGAAVGRIVVP